jgi:hypothetical protein
LLGGGVTPQTLFGPAESDPEPKPAGDASVRMSVLVTVKAAPNPSERYGETVCVAGVRAEFGHPGWIRLYPIRFRDLPHDDTFRKYQVITLDAVPARGDQRRESWKPIMSSIVQGAVLPPWAKRRDWLDDYLEDSMCKLNSDARHNANAKSLALVRPQDVSGLLIERHPGWTIEEQKKINKYVNQPDLFDSREKTPLQAPRFRAKYKYRCHDRQCGGHVQGLLDWEFVTLQRRLAALTDAEAYNAMRERFVTTMCGPRCETAFFVGNQAKRAHVFSVLGVYYPTR